METGGGEGGFLFVPDFSDNRGIDLIHPPLLWLCLPFLSFVVSVFTCFLTLIFMISLINLVRSTASSGE